jgi:KaiC/GvpD/RAD55 family RecA-like ATPase
MPTGITGLDEMIEGGLPRPSLTHVEINLARRRSLEVLKMCGTSHHLGKHAVDISVKGFVVYPGL